MKVVAVLREWTIGMPISACMEFGCSNHGPAVSDKGGFGLYLDAYDPCTSDVALKSKIHPTTASAEFKYL
jgi:hypothetical protein